MSLNQADQTQSMPGEILLRFFRSLDSKDMVAVCRVNRQWLQIINEHQNLWRRLVLPKDNTGGHHLALDLFDRKSHSTLKEVSIQSGGEEQANSIIQVLRRSEQTLTHLRLIGLDKLPLKNFVEGPISSSFSNLSITLSNLIDFRLFEAGEFNHYYCPNVNIQTDIIELQPNSPNLRVLWIWKCDDLFIYHLPMLRNLTSLVLHHHLEAQQWRMILEEPARTLKHLGIQIHEFDEGENHPILEFPNLEVLELMLYGTYPSWMVIPSSSIFISKPYHIPRNLPSINEIWVGSLLRWELNLSDRCPILRTLRLNFDKKVEAQIKRILPLLKKRMENVEAGLEVDGVIMIPLERLILPTRFLKLELLTKLREMVEVIDIKTVPRLIDVSI